MVQGGGFEANIPWMREHWGEAAENFLVRGTPYNTGKVLKSLLGQGVRDGVEVAFAEINAGGGVGGRKLQFIAEDDGYEPMRTIASARKLVEQDKVVALLAVTGTAPSAALLPFVAESKTPLLFPYAFSHSLTTPVKRDVFTTCWPTTS